jgi:hypothetical protein
MHSQSAHALAAIPLAETPRPDAVDDLACAHARTLEKAVAHEFDRRARRMPFAPAPALCGLSAELMQEFAEDLLNDLVIMAERHGLTAGWIMDHLTDALVDGAQALEEAAPAGARPSVANVLQICRVDFEWRSRAALGLAIGD